MARQPEASTKTADLRRKAETLLGVTKRDVAAMPVQDVQQLVHELQVHQIELEMQNEELRLIQLDLEASRDRYANLYDFAPAGHITLDRHGIIVEANLRAGTLLQTNSKALIGQSLAGFVTPDYQDILQRHCQDVLKTGTRQVCEVYLRKKCGDGYCVLLESLAVHEEPGRILRWRMSLLNISDRKRAEADIQHSETFLSSILENLPNMVFVKDAKDLRFVRLNKAGEDLLGYLRDELIGKNDYDFFQKDEADFFARTDREVLAHGRLVDIPEEPIQTRSSGVRYLHTRKIPIVGKEGTPQYLLGISEDITDRKRTQEALREREHEFHLLADNVPAFYAYVDTELRYRFVNKRYEDLFGRPAADIVGRPVKDLVGELNFDKLESHLRGAVAGQAISFIYPMTLPNGDARWMNVQYTPDGDGAGPIKGVLVLASDVTAQAQAELALKQSQLGLMEKREELQALAEKLLTAQDEERKRIARDLHDDINQRLAALSVELESMERAPISLPEPTARQLAAVRAQVVQLSDDLHNLAYGLHPSLLDHVGLEMALRDHVAEFAKRTGLSVVCDVHNVPLTLSKEIATNLFRVMQESLQNVSKHAEATNVTVRLCGSSKGVGLSVRDNGKGFDLEKQKDYSRGLGLASMQERARLLGGFLRIHSLPRDGTKVCAWIPRAPEGT